MKKTVFITGCSTGIGRALALELSESGYTVFASARNLDSMDELKSVGIHTLELDINNRESISAARELLESKINSLDILINNAGYAEMGPLLEMPDDVFEKQFQTNVFSQVAVTKAFFNLLRGKESKVVNISSVSGDFTTPFAGAYCSTKAALSSLSDALRMELKPFGISVIDVRPGAIKSHFGETAGKGVINWLPENSVYKKIRDGIMARANASQDNPTPVDIFARALVKKLSKKNPSKIIRLGRGARLLYILGRWLPKSLMDKILSKKFKLNILQESL